MIKKLAIISISLIVVILLLIIVFMWFAFGTSQADLLMTSISPDGKYTVEAYRVNSGATVDFSVKVYVITEKGKKLIYNVYHEYEVDIIWVNSDVVSINGKQLDLSKGETYDWRNT